MRNKVFHGDCLEIMPMLPDKSVDMILCDLPYGVTSLKWDSVIPFEPLWREYKRLIKDNGAIVLTASQPFTSALVMSNIKWFKYDWIWKKSRPVGFLNAKKMPLKNIESILVFGKGNIIYNPQGLTQCYKIKKNSKTHQNNQSRGESTANGGRLGDAYIQEFSNYPSQVVYFPSESNTIHPTQKPVALFEYLIRTYTNEGDLVLDNCAGSFTTAIAAMNTNRDYICIEKDDKYFELGCRRIAQHEQRTMHLEFGV